MARVSHDGLAWRPQKPSVESRNFWFVDHAHRKPQLQREDATFQAREVEFQPFDVLDSCPSIVAVLGFVEVAQADADGHFEIVYILSHILEQWWNLETQLAEDFSYLSVNSVYLENCVLEEGLLGGICEDDAHFIVKPTENEARYLWAPEIGGEQTQENCFS